MKIAILVLLLIVAVAFAANSKVDTAFSKWATLNKKQYKGTKEYNLRKSIFAYNMKMIEEHNAKNLSFTLGLNQFADLTNTEFRALYTQRKFDATKYANKNIPVPEAGALPTTVDWVKEGVVTGIKNQGQCGSCWSFSTTGNVEGAYALATKTLVGLSEQQLVDCSDSYGNEGCNGGLMDDAFQYIIAVGGLETEKAYPYTAQDGTCQCDKSKFVADISGYQDVTSDSESALQIAVANVGPISVAIDAGLSSFQFYSGGVYYDASCSSTQLDHGVLAVGYGVYQGSDYWLVKNSWGTSWGLNGYIMMSRNRNNNCGIATMASYSTGAHKAATL